MDPIVHFEIPVDTMDRAKKFYASIFGWNLQDWPMPDGSNYVGIRTTPIDEKTRLPLKPGAINGGMMKRNDTITYPIIAANVKS
ncbi:VOC family protein, partial [Candidatus Peregrinibacteria bacterium]|nr:VOC family protein [Candidatus Peregrinibacteria bacterium]